MTTRILMKVGEIKVANSTAGRKIVTIHKGTTAIPVNYDNNEIKTETGGGVAMANHGNANTIRTDPNGTTNTPIGNIRGIVFDLPNKEAEFLVRYLKFKEKVKEAKDVFGNTYIDLRGLKYDDAVVAGDTTAAGTFGDLVEGDKIKLTENSFTFGLDSSRENWKKSLWFINPDNAQPLNALNYANTATPGLDGTAAVDNSNVESAFKEELQALEETKELINNIENSIAQWKGGATLDSGVIDDYIKELEDYLGGLEGANYQYGDGTNMPNFPGGATNPSAILVAGRNAGGADNLKKVKILAKKALFDLDLGIPLGDVADNHYYKSKIFGTPYNNTDDYGWGGYYQLVCELKIWKELGFNTLVEIARANANGYYISNRGTDINSVGARPPEVTIFGDNTHRGKIFGKKKDGSIDGDAAININAIKTALDTKKYLNFDMINVGETAADAPVGDQTNRYREIYGLRFNPSPNQTAEKITAFRDNLIKFGYMADGKVPSGGNSGKGLNDHATITDRRDCMGYGCGDTIYGDHGIENEFCLLTKVELEILQAPNRQTAINLAFYGQDYTATGKSPTPKNSLKLNESSAKNFFLKETKDDGSGFKDSLKGANWHDTSPTKEKILRNYYEVMKITSAINTWTDAKYNDAAAQTEINAAFNTAYQWALIWDRWTSGTTPSKTQAQTDKEALDGFLGKEGRAPTEEQTKLVNANPDWKAEMERIHSRAVAVINDDDSEDRATSADIDQAEKDSGVTTEKAKEVFTKAKQESPPPTKKVVKELGKLVKLLEEVHTGIKGHDEAYDELNGYKENSGDKGEAWKIADQVDDGGKNYATKALEKLTAELDTAKANARNELGEEAFNKITEGKTKVKEFNDIKDLFHKASRAWGLNNKTETGYQELKDDLTTAKGNEAWKAVNKYAKDKSDNTCSDGYAAGALKRLEDFKEKADKGKKKIWATTSPTTAREVWKNLPSDEKSNVDEKDMKRWQAYLTLKDGSDKEKELASIFKEEQEPADKYGNRDNDNDLNAINKVIEILKKYKEIVEDDKSDEGKILQKLRTIDAEFGDPKNVISYWLNKMELQQKVLQTAKDQRDKNNPNQNKDPKNNPWTSGWAIFAYCVIGVIIIGGVVWMFRKGESEEI